MSKLKEIDIPYELFMTFSNKKSLLSSKRIERYFSYTSATLIIIVYVVCRFFCFKCVSDINVGEIVLVSGTLYGYGIYNTEKIAKEKTEEQSNGNGEN